MPECKLCGARVYPSDGIGCADCCECPVCGKKKRESEMHEYDICKDCHGNIILQEDEDE